MIQDRWCFREGEAPGYNSSVRGTADARDPDVQKWTLAGNCIVMARAGSTAIVGRPVGPSQVQHTDGIIVDRAVIQQHTEAIRTVQGDGTGSSETTP